MKSLRHNSSNASPRSFAVRPRGSHGRKRVGIPMAVLSGLALILGGCFSPMHTRFPTVYTGYPRSERMAYQQQDPFPDPDIGPDSSGRPREYARPRTAPRKAAEQRLFQGLPNTPENIPGGNPRGAQTWPGTVR
ncbi:MAG: hypothetical protein R3C49_05185 [Planctomycetaceae bacterium]